MAGLTPVSAGRITLAGQLLDDADQGTFVEASGRPIGFVFQNYRLFPHMSVADNVAFSPRARGQGKQAARSAASYWLDRLGLAELAERKPGQLSGGQAQRVALARALAGQPSLLLLDEPLSALDAGTRLDVQAELKRHLADFSGPCLLVTHDPIEALVLADQVVVLEHGRVVQQGTPALIARQPGTDYVAKLVGLNLYAGRADGSAVALADGGAFVIPDHGQHGDVLVAVRPSAIVVSTQPPQSSSARNTWQAKITGLTLLADRVRLDLDGSPHGPGRRHARRGHRTVPRPRQPGVAHRQGHRPRGLPGTDDRRRLSRAGADHRSRSVIKQPLTWQVRGYRNLRLLARRRTPATLPG